MAEQNHTPSMIGFYSHDPRAADTDEPIELFEILSALEATSVILSETVDTNDISRNEGLTNAIRTLVALLRQRDTGEEVIKKPCRAPRRPGPPKPRKTTPPGAVVSLVRPSAGERVNVA